MGEVTNVQEEVKTGGKRRHALFQIRSRKGWTTWKDRTGKWRQSAEISYYIYRNRCWRENFKVQTPGIGGDESLTHRYSGLSSKFCN